MKFALIDGVKALPQPKVIGICLFCGSRMKANCGKHKIWHWAHISKQDCDPWWESETEWHRQWKNYFPIEYQEVIHIDNNTGEKHIADIKTKNDMVIEFQNSPITREEVSSREDYYKKMFWVVNGDRKGTLNRTNFELGIGTQYKTKSKDPFIIEFLWIGRSKLFENWSFSKVPVFLILDTMNYFGFMDTT